MDRVWLALALAGCTAGGGGPVIPTDPSAACEAVGDGYSAATTGALNFSTLIVNGTAVIPDVASVQSCVSDAGDGAAWLFGAYGGDYGIVRVFAVEPGPIPLPSPGMVVDLFGNDPAILFDGEDFFQGNLVVNTTDPFGVTLQDGSASTSDGHQIAIAFTATASL